MKQPVLKRFIYQTESNKCYSLLKESDYNIDDGIELNPYAQSNDIFDTLVVVARSVSLPERTNFNIRNTEFGFHLEVYSSVSSEVFIVDGKLDLEMIFAIIEKLKDTSYSDSIKHLQYKYGLKSEYFFN